MLLRDAGNGRGLGRLAAGGGVIAAAAALMAALAAFVAGDAAAAYMYQVICNSSKALAWMFNNVLRAKFGVSFGTDVAGICKVRRAQLEPPMRYTKSFKILLPVTSVT